MGKTYIHNGPIQNLKADASPGLRFLAAFLPVVDSLSANTGTLSTFLTPNATFIMNGSDPVPTTTVTEMMKMRSERLKVFRNDLKAAWDVEMEGGKRTVLYETVSVTIFKDDKEEKAVEVSEFSTMELHDGVGAKRGRL
jgi:hypothetical protein